MPRLVLVLAFAALALALASAEWPTLQPYAETLPGSAGRLQMAPVPFRGDAPGFWISRQAVSAAEYAAYLAERPGPGTPAASARPVALTSSPDPDGGGPAVVTFAEAAAYASWLAAKTGHGYRLPSETEWEQACRAAQDAEGRSAGTDRLGGAPEWTLHAARGRAAQGDVVKGGGPADASDACASERPADATTLAGFRVMRPYEAGRH